MEYINPTCGCNIANNAIKYCSKHNAAEELYEASLEAYNWIRDELDEFDDDGELHCIEIHLLNALAKAEIK